MRFAVFALTLFCLIMYASLYAIDTPAVKFLPSPQRQRREADPGNTISSDAYVDSGGEDKLSAKYKCEQKLYDENGTCIKTFRDVNVRQGEKPHTIKGVQVEKRGNSPSKNSVDMVVTSNSDQKISATLDASRRLYQKNGMTVDASGNINYNSGQRPRSNLRIDIDKTFSHGYVGGFGQVNRGSNGSLSPSVGVSCGFRFKRDTKEVTGEN